MRIVSDWDSSGLLRQTPGGAGMWDGICFTTRPVEECDLLVMSNSRKLDPVTAQWRVWVGEWEMEDDAPGCEVLVSRFRR